MDVVTSSQLPADAGADGIVVGVFEGEGPSGDSSGGAVARLLGHAEARRTFRRLAVTHEHGLRYIVVGLGARADFTAERARVAAATALGRVSEVSCATMCWRVPDGLGGEHIAAIVEGTVMAAYEYRAFKTCPGETGAPDTLIVCLPEGDDDGGAAAVALGHRSAQAANAARDLQNAPPNVMTPTALAERARALADQIDGLSVEVMDRAAIEAAGMGAFAAVARGSQEEPALITLRFDGPNAAGPRLGLVGKAVTFDSGGISIKPAGRMADMKFDMSGGAAVLEATAAIAREALPLSVVSVIGAAENMPSGRSVRPGDIVTARNGTTIEVLNTDAEGRLVLADCLTHAIEQGAERLVDVATLTGAIVTALGTTHAGIMGVDDAWIERVTAAGARAGELLWRMPLHPEYAEAIKGRYADIANAVENRRAGSVTAAEFLHRFTGELPWAHLDIAGTAWDTGRPYAAKGGTGFGTRLLIELARDLAAG